MFEKNVGGLDRFLRFAVSIALIFWAIKGGGFLAWLGLPLLLTAISSRCLLYRLAGYRTCPAPVAKSKMSVRYNLK